MPIIHLYDRATIEASITLPLDPELRHLLAVRVAHLRRQGLLDMSELVVINKDTHPAEIVAALGFDPLDGLGGSSWGQPGYVTMLDYVSHISPSYHEAIVTVGNSGFAFQLLIHDSADADLVALCREQAA